MMDEAELLKVARQVAYNKGKQWGLRDPKDLLAGAWHGAKRAVDRGVTDKNVIMYAAMNGIIDWLREFKPDGLTRLDREEGRQPPEQFTEHTLLASQVIDHRTQEPNTGELLEAWSSFRHYRAHLSMLVRVTMYLYYVEGMMQKDIAETLTIHCSAISHHAEAFRKAMRRVYQ